MGVGQLIRNVITVETDPTVANFTKSLTSNNTILTAVNAATGTISASVLPSYVDDVLNFVNLAAFPVAGETGKIYVTEDNNKTYRWSGSVYVEISSSATAGEALKLTTPRTISATGDITGSISGFDGSANVSGAMTLATVNSNVGAFGSASSIPAVTVNAKGQVTAVSTNSIGNELIAIQALGDTPGFLRKTGDGTYSIDTSTYLTSNQSISVSGDATGSGSTAITLTLANSGVTAGTYNNSATQVRPFTVDAKGRITGVGTPVNIAPPWSVITGTPTTLSGYGITNALPLTGGTVTGDLVSTSATISSSTTTGAIRAASLGITGAIFAQNLYTTGNVGIATVSPTEKLEVNGNIKLSSTAGSTSTPSYIWLGNNYSDGATRDKLKIYLYSSGGEQYGFGIGAIADVQYHSNVYHDFYTANSLSVRINGSGNVGIGTTTPSQKLDVNGSAKATSFFVGTNQVVSSRKTGWSAPTGTATRTTFATSTVTLSQLAETVKALIDDLSTHHGLIGS